MADGCGYSAELIIHVSPIYRVRCSSLTSTERSRMELRLRPVNEIAGAGKGSDSPSQNLQQLPERNSAFTE